MNAAQDSPPVPKSEPAQFLTIGHSNRSAAEFIELLTDNAAEVVVDVRRLPGSNANPQFNADALEATMAESGIDLRRLEGLTGRRPVNHEIPFAANGWWQNRSFHNYADHALGEEFAGDLGTLLGWGSARDAEQRVAVMCSEAVWWRCHRRIIADHLLARDHRVLHVLGKGHAAEAQLSQGAHVTSKDGRIEVTYPEVTHPAEE